jgi:hypothetical protein
MHAQRAGRQHCRNSKIYGDDHPCITRSELVATDEWSHCVISCRPGWVVAACGPGGQVSGDRRLACAGPRRFSGRRGLGCREELVHDLGAGGDHRS